jgi:hypothetical protein
VRLEEIVNKDKLHSPMLVEESLFYNIKDMMINHYSLSIRIIAQVVVVS